MPVTFNEPLSFTQVKEGFYHTIIDIMKCYFLQRLVEDIEYVDLLYKAAGKGIQHNSGIKTTYFLLHL